MRWCIFGIVGLGEIIHFSELEMFMGDELEDFLVEVDLVANIEVILLFEFNFMRVMIRIKLVFGYFLIDLAVAFELVVLFLVDEVEFEHFSGFLFDETCCGFGSDHLEKVSE